MKKITFRLMLLLIGLFPMLSKAANCPEPSAKIVIVGKTITVAYTLAGDTDVRINITDEKNRVIETIEHDKSAEGSYKVTYKLTRKLKEGDYNVNVLYDNNVTCSKVLKVQ